MPRALIGSHPRRTGETTASDMGVLSTAVADWGLAAKPVFSGTAAARHRAPPPIQKRGG